MPLQQKMFSGYLLCGGGGGEDHGSGEGSLLVNFCSTARTIADQNLIQGIENGWANLHFWVIDK